MIPSPDVGVAWAVTDDFLIASALLRRKLLHSLLGSLPVTVTFAKGAQDKTLRTARSRLSRRAGKKTAWRLDLSIC
jgi:hypothetical protein